MSDANRSLSDTSLTFAYPAAMSGILDPLQRRFVTGLTAATMLLFWAIYYAFCMYPGLGGEINSGDSAKFQILGHTPIMVHGPGYPFVLLLGTVVRALDLPFSPWWTFTFALSVLPAALANSLAFLIVHRLTGHLLVGVAASLLLGSATLMTIQATEAEVYPLALAFTLATLYLLTLYVQTKQLKFFIIACAVYSLSFGNHLMMIMLVPMFIWIAVTHYKTILRPYPVGIILLLIALGASQYLYLAYVAYDPRTSYSEYMPLPPSVPELIEYIAGSHFSGLYGSGFRSTRQLQTLYDTLWSAHPWISVPIIAAGILLFIVSWKHRDASWRGIAVLFGGALAFTPFMLWYGAHDIRAFHLPVLGPLLLASVGALGWWLRRYPALLTTIAVIFIVVGLVRAGERAAELSGRAPVHAELQPAIEAMVAQAPGPKPVIALGYSVRMAALYHQLRGELPAETYRLTWRAADLAMNRRSVGGTVVPFDRFRLVRRIETRRPDMRCHTTWLHLPEGVRWKGYAFKCEATRRSP